jgi:uncharacterized membrane protein YfcA
MTIVGLSAAAALGLVSGTSIGCIGIGGVILVPIMVQFGIPIHTAIASAMAGYILTGLVGTGVFIKKGTLDWRSARWLLAGAMPAAILGSIAAKAAPSFLLELFVALLTGFTGFQSLVRASPKIDTRQSKFILSNATRGWLGAFTGFLSALTGTGGPVVLVPILLWLEVPVLAAIGLAQAIQLPIAVLATVSNTVNGTLDALLALELGIGLTVGAWIGARLAHSLNQQVLRRIVATVLIAICALSLFRIGRGFIG